MKAQELLHPAAEGGHLMSGFCRWGKMASELAMTCLSHMALSPVGFQQIGSGCQHMASAAHRLHGRILLPSLCPAIFFHYSMAHSLPAFAILPLRALLTLFIPSDLKAFVESAPSLSFPSS